jgi:hypothetical protein
VSFEDTVRITLVSVFMFYLILYGLFRLYARGYRDGKGDMMKSVIKVSQEKVRPGEHEPVCDCPVPDMSYDRVCLQCFGYVAPPTVKNAPTPHT